jgi:hypothetical protein
MTIFAPASYPSSYPSSAVRDYPTLKQAIQDWFARSDVGAYLDYFIQMAEERIYRDIPAMNAGRYVQPMETALNVTIANGVAALPVGYVGLKHALVSVGGNTWELQRRNAEFIYTQYPNRNPDGTPAYIAREGQNFIFGPFPDSNYVITGTYWQRFPPLTSSNPTTWMTETTPLMLLQACNAAVATFLKDTDAFQMWEPAYQQTMRSFLLADRAEEQSGSAMAMVAG